MKSLRKTQAMVAILCIMLTAAFMPLMPQKAFAVANGDGDYTALTGVDIQVTDGEGNVKETREAGVGDTIKVTVHAWGKSYSLNSGSFISFGCGGSAFDFRLDVASSGTLVGSITLDEENIQYKRSGSYVFKAALINTTGSGYNDRYGPGQVSEAVRSSGFTLVGGSDDAEPPVLKSIEKTGGDSLYPDTTIKYTLTISDESPVDTVNADIAFSRMSDPSDPLRSGEYRSFYKSLVFEGQNGNDYTFTVELTGEDLAYLPQCYVGVGAYKDDGRGHYSSQEYQLCRIKDAVGNELICPEDRTAEELIGLGFWHKMQHEYVSVVQEINAIGEITSLEQKAQVERARADYDALPDSEKALVPEEVIQVLENAERAIDDLKEPLLVGDQITVGYIVYTVTDAAEKTVSAKFTTKGKKKCKYVTIPETVVIKDWTCQVTGISAKGFAKAKKLKSFKVESSELTKIGSKAFQKSKKLKTLKLTETDKLTKEGVRNSLKGSRIKTVVVKPEMKAAYKTIFTKKNCGKKVKVR